MKRKLSALLVFLMAALLVEAGLIMTKYHEIRVTEKEVIEEFFSDVDGYILPGSKPVSVIIYEV